MTLNEAWKIAKKKKMTIEQFKQLCIDNWIDWSSCPTYRLKELES